MECPNCKTEFDTTNFPTKCKSLTVVCHSCGLQMTVEKRPFLGWKWLKITERDGWKSASVTPREKVNE